ncbi:helix-turn-helix domain-containing protein [Nocardia cyriacigeorgica]|uniref:helix-turn-helix domain-containing protein n=1 Tax=Nocardia cyriacigeorgica TaxID=135487 RepID=UPI001893F2B1|nr:helix-turn-helix transcriptional regulator [Nocardia cyriacigeorgica]MBF6161047.1 helix-turn-helix transcriptional regulator [Nocardia cyriacigeorgica]MBF6199846.1 helix-turn-helix transcriptional regulator [Nocardia cyriacigeorgica]
MFTDGGSVSGELLRELRGVAGISLRTMAARTCFTPGYLSLVETGGKPITPAVLDAYRKVLGDPTLGLAGVDAERLAATVTDPASAGRSSLEDVSVILERTRHLEDTAGAALVAPVVRGIDGVARALAAERVGGGSAAGLASEVARYRGWLEHALGCAHIANRSLEDAAQLAQAADDPDQLAHSLSFRAYTARHQGDTARAVALTEGAIAVVGAHPILAVYDRYQRAELLALRREDRKAGKALAAADTAAEAASEVELPSFGYWYTAGFWGVQRGVVLALLGRQAEAVREAEQGIAAMPPEHRCSGWLASMLRQVHPEMMSGES